MVKKKKTVKGRKLQKRSLQELTPQQFENLIFDLMISCGMTNVVWRTPGADGGRDIEGVTFERDLSGLQSSKKWFVECKRYSASVDWPTIYEKVSYADSLHADFLLMCTTSHFSPAAITQVATWNASRRSLAIRLWPTNEIDQRLDQYPDLQLKYGLSNVPAMPGPTLLQLALAVSKAVSTSYSRLVFSGMTPDSMLDASQALSDLLLRRMEDLAKTGRILPSFTPAIDLSVPGCKFVGGDFHVDDAGLVAFVSYLIALNCKPLTIQRVSARSCKIVAKQNLRDIVQRYRRTFDAISIWSDFEFDLSKTVINIRQRS